MSAGLARYRASSSNIRRLPVRFLFIERGIICLSFNGTGFILHVSQQ
jgi:hypothetical protein